MLLENAWKESPLELEFNEWVALKKKTCSQFLYWYTVLELEALLLMFVKSIREGNFTEYLEALEQIIPWMFIMDHTNYAR